MTVTDSNKLTATATRDRHGHRTPSAASDREADGHPRPSLSTGGTSTLDASGSAATAPNATLTGYAFDCGDGCSLDQASSTGTATVTCTYAKAGKFTASPVTVTDSNKLTATAQARPSRSQTRFPSLRRPRAPAPVCGPGPPLPRRPLERT